MSLDEDAQEEYDKRFDALDLYFLDKANIPLEKAIKYSRRFDGAHIALFIKKGISPEQARRYGKRFGGSGLGSSELGSIVDAGVPPEIANRYKSRLNGFVIADLFKIGISPEKANSYKKSQDAAIFVGAKIPPEIANSYKRFSTYDIITLFRANITPEIANAYSRPFKADQIIELVKFMCSPEKEMAYDPIFTGWQVVHLVQNGIPPEIANRYKRFAAPEIVCLLKADVDPIEASKYPGFGGSLISILHKIGIRPYGFSSKQKETLFELFKKIGLNKKIKEEPQEFSLIDTGSSGVILLYRENAWKFSLNAAYEARLIRLTMNLTRNRSFIKKAIKYIGRRLGLASCKDTSHVISTKGDVIEDIAIPLEYVHGSNIEKLIEKNHKFEDRTIEKCGYDVFKGLEELNAAGIYHRDIRTSNVIIDRKKDRAVIIDLGIATDDPNAMPKDNRRYGGSDLMSLGQLMYKMATGHNLFNEYSKPSLEAADDIERLRKQFYYDKATRVDYLRKVGQKVKDIKLRSIIRTCLRAGLTVGEQQNLTPKDTRERAYAQVRGVFKRHMS